MSKCAKFHADIPSPLQKKKSSEEETKKANIKRLLVKKECKSDVFMVCLSFLIVFFDVGVRTCVCGREATLIFLGREGIVTSERKWPPCRSPYVATRTKR